jgi:hypothetical protein
MVNFSAFNNAIAESVAELINRARQATVQPPVEVEGLLGASRPHRKWLDDH